VAGGQKRSGGKVGGGGGKVSERAGVVDIGKKGDSLLRKSVGVGLPTVWGKHLDSVHIKKKKNVWGGGAGRHAGKMRGKAPMKGREARRQSGFKLGKQKLPEGVEEIAFWGKRPKKKGKKKGGPN